MSARELVGAGRLFDVQENSTRVALARLSAEGTIEATARGMYQLGSGTEELTQQVLSWRTVEQRLRRWDGGWVCVAAGDLSRGDRSALRRRARALRMLGLAELRRALWLRPDNLEGGVGAVRERLHALGLERSAMVFRGDGFDAELEARARALWNGSALTASYQRGRERMETWMTRMGKLDPETAARESFLIGGDAIRQIVFDPLLPSPLCDAAERRAFVETAVRFDAAGRRAWMRLYGLQLGIDGSSAVRRAELLPS